MAAPNYGPVSNFADDGQPVFQSPEMMGRPWRSSMGSSPQLQGIEMQQNPRPDLPYRPSQISFASDGSMPKPAFNETTYESRPFLQTMPQKSVSMDSTVTTASFKAKTGKQLRHLLLGSSIRWVISLLLCAAWVLAARITVRDGAVTELKKRYFNAATTGIGLALGLNIASAFKDMALNMRWPILASRERNLYELDLILRADSLSELSKLVFKTRRIGVIVACIFWLLLNIAAQAGIAAVSLTYGFETDSSTALLSTGAALTANVTRFYPMGLSPADFVGNYEDESFTAHQYGAMVPLWMWNTTTVLPAAGRIFQPWDGLVYLNNETNTNTFVFLDTSPGGGYNAIQIFTERTLNSTYECESHEVTAGGDGLSADITVANIGTVHVGQVLQNSTVFFQDNNKTCPDANPRCAVVEAFETANAFSNTAWYYRCNITIGQTQNDTSKLQSISDDMAYYAAASIAQGGWVGSASDDENDPALQSAQIFPQSSFFGSPYEGSKDAMGQYLTFYAVGSIAVASLYNPSQSYIGNTPSSGQQLTVGHAVTFIGILFLLLIFQLIFIIVVAIWANKVKVGEDSHLGMSVLMRPIADRLDDIGQGRETRAFKKAKKQVKVKYEKDPVTNHWSFKMKN